MKLILAPSLGFLAASLSSLVACSSTADGLDGAGGAPDDGPAATGGQLASTGGASPGAGGDQSATPASALLTVNGAHCTGYFVTVSITEYGQVGGKIAGSFSADLLDAMQTGECPTGISGEFSVRRKR